MVHKSYVKGNFYSLNAAAAAKSLQLCPTLCDPIDGRPGGSPVPMLLLARTPEWLAISFSNAWKWKVKVKSLSCVWLFAIPCTAAYQAPPSMGFSRQEYWSGLPLLYLSLLPGMLFCKIWLVACCHRLNQNVTSSKRTFVKHLIKRSPTPPHQLHNATMFP